MLKVFIEFLNSLDFIEFLKSLMNPQPRIDPICFVTKKSKHKKKRGSSTVTNSIKTLNIIHI